MGETFDMNYFSGTDYLEAVNIYKSSMFKFMRDILSDTKNDLTCGIIKPFYAVEIDKMLDFANKDEFNLAEIHAKFNTIAYSMQSNGGNFMQNNNDKRVRGSFEEILEILKILHYKELFLEMNISQVNIFL